MKILQVCALGCTAEVLLLPQIDYFLKLNVEVEIACSPDAITEKLQQQGYVIHPIQIDRKISLISNLVSLVNLTKLMRSQIFLRSRLIVER